MCARVAVNAIAKPQNRPQSERASLASRLLDAHLMHKVGKACRILIHLLLFRQHTLAL